MNSSVEFERDIFGGDDSGNATNQRFRVFFKKTLPSVPSPSAKIYISPFHDISLYSESGSNVYRMIVTEPRWTNIRYRMQTTESFNPIAPVVENDRIGFYKNIFPFHGVPANLGFLPQTWEMPNYECPNTDQGLKGTNDALNVIELGTQVHRLGSVVDVKVLGAFALIDNNEVVWKILSIDINDALASKLNELDDIYNYMPMLAESTIEWFKCHKLPDDEGRLLQLANRGQVFDRGAAYEKIEQSHKFWRSLIKNELYFRQSRECANFKLLNTQCLEGHDENLKSASEADSIVEAMKAAIVNEPVEALAKLPSPCEMESVFYLEKTEFDKKLIRGGQIESMKIDEDEEPKWRHALRLNLGRYVAPIAVSTMAGFVIYYTYKQKFK